MSTTAVGIDIGGTGIKGAIVNVATGELLSDRVKLLTPKGGRPHDIVATVQQLIEQLGDIETDAPVGLCFPSVIVDGKTLSAANVSDEWIGLHAEKLFEDGLRRDIHFVNDADAAGYAETHYGAAKDVDGLVIMTTLGTGIGTAFVYDGVLIPNVELGHLEIEGTDWETMAAYSAKERDNLDWDEWAARLQKFYVKLEAYFYPTRFIVGGGVSKNFQEFLPLLNLRTPIVPAVLRNNAGILGAAALASKG